MKRFKVRELIINLPMPEDMELDRNAGFREAEGAFDAGYDRCNQVTFLDCGSALTHGGCGVTLACSGNTLACRQVTLLECADGVTKVVCDGRTLEPQCRQVTLVDCGVTRLGAPQAPGTYFGPRCCPTTTRTDKCPDPPKPDPPNTKDQCCNPPTRHGPKEELEVRVRTVDIGRMGLEDLSLLKQQLKFALEVLEVREDSFMPQDPEDLEVLEAKLKESLQEVQKRRGKGGGGGKTP